MNRGVRMLGGLAVVTTLAACGGGTPTPPSPGPERTTVAEPVKLAKESPAEPEFTAFRSPSGNVGCYLEVGYVRCDIAERNWSPPRPADCEFDYGQGITLVPGGSAEFVCAGDTALVPDGAALPYGESIAAGPLRCDSAESGITCRDTETGKGFSISRDAYQLF